jgi:small ligand-binding sensory domain FIST
MASDAPGLLEGARRAGEAAALQLDGPARMTLVFSCCTRVPLLGERLAEEVGVIASALGNAPAGGFYTCGEFARVTGSAGIHNSSVAILAL